MPRRRNSSKKKNKRNNHKNKNKNSSSSSPSSSLLLLTNDLKGIAELIKSNKIHNIGKLARAVYSIDFFYFLSLCVCVFEAYEIENRIICDVCY